MDDLFEYPVSFVSLGERTYWRFGDRWFWDNEDLTDDQVYALIVTREQRRQASINRAKSTVAMTQAPPLPLAAQSQRTSSSLSGTVMRKVSAVWLQHGVAV